MTPKTQLPGATVTGSTTDEATAETATPSIDRLHSTIQRIAANVLEAGLSDYATGLAADLKAAACEAASASYDTPDLSTLLAVA